MTKQSCIYVVGAGSRLFRSMRFTSEYTPVSGRLDAIDTIPVFATGALIIVFADPPGEHQTTALLLSVLRQVGCNAGCRIVYVSSIAANFRNSSVFPFEGPYSKKKRCAELLLLSRADLDICIVRVGNVFAHGGWHAVRSSTHWALLPAGFDRTAVSTSQDVHHAINWATALPPGHHILRAWHAVPSKTALRGVVAVPKLLGLYRLGALRLPIKILVRILRPLGIYLPSHDDLNSFLVR